MAYKGRTEVDRMTKLIKYSPGGIYKPGIPAIPNGIKANVHTYNDGGVRMKAHECKRYDAPVEAKPTLTRKRAK